MGRRKVPVKLIEDKNSRRVTFSKRRKGLIKKAREISVLCDVDVAVIVFSGGDRLYEYCSSDSLPGIIQRYHSSSGTDPTVSRDGSKEESTNASFISSELLQIAERVEEAHLDELSVADLLQVEEQIAVALTHIRSTKTQLMMEPVQALQNEETVLEEENNALTNELEASKNDENGQNNAGKHHHHSQPLLLKFL